MDTLAPAKTVASVSLIEADRDPEGFSQELGRSFERYGFAIVADHGIPADLIHRAEEKAKAFFALSEEVKCKYHQKGGGGARGYTPFGIETAKGAVNYDLKEFWHVARELPPGHKYERLDGAQPLARRGRVVPRHLPRIVRGVRPRPASSCSRRSPAISASRPIISSTR